MLGILNLTYDESIRKTHMKVDYSIKIRPRGERDVLSLEVPLDEAKRLAISINKEIKLIASDDGSVPDGVDFKVIVLRQALKFYEEEAAATQKIIQDCTGVLNFGDEDTSHVTEELLDICSHELKLGLYSLVDNVYRNNKVPANRNTYHIDNLNTGVLLDGEWQIRETKEVLNQMVTKMAGLLQAYIDKKKTEKEKSEDKSSKKSEEKQPKEKKKAK